MIISISSSPIVDTSGLVAELSKKYNLPVIADPMRQACERRRFQTIYDMPGDLQKEVRWSLLKDHLGWLKGKASGLLDFSPVAWCADWMRWMWSDTPTAEWEKVFRVLGECVAEYDRIYHVVNGPLRPYDGYVWRDANNAKQVEGLMRFLYQELGVMEKITQVRFDSDRWNL